MKGNHRPRQFDEAVRRSHDQILLLDQQVLDAVTTTITSNAVLCAAFRHFALYLRILSANTPTTVQFLVQFANEPEGPWHSYLQGPFASLFYEDGDTDPEVQHLFTGTIAGRALRIRAVGVGTSATNTFTISAVLDLWD